MVFLKKVGICFILLLFFIVRPVRAVEISNLTTNQVIGQISVKELDQVYLSYTMSLYKVPQAELIRAKNKEFVVEKVVFGSYAAALYYCPGEEFEKDKLDAGYWMIEPNYHTQKINFANAFFSEHRLVQKNLKWSVSINRLGASGGDLIQLSTKWTPVIAAVIREKQFLDKVSRHKEDIDPPVLKMLLSLK